MYADRKARSNDDGTPLFATDEDVASELGIMQRVEVAWHCELHRFGRLCQVDCYALRSGRFVGVAEIKRRQHESKRYPTVFLNVRKWIALQMASAGICVPAIFIVGFDDRIMWIDVARVQGRVRIGGHAQIVKSHSDIEPVFEVPVSEMRGL